MHPGEEQERNGLTDNRSGRRNRARLSPGEGSRQSSKWNYGLISKIGSGTVADDGNDADYLMMGQEEAKEDIRNWQCKCPTGYIGPTCEISVCDNNPCQYGGTCIPYPGSGYLCLCPFGKHGHYCEHSEYNSLINSFVIVAEVLIAKKIQNKQRQQLRQTIKVHHDLLYFSFVC